jgi:hypothetical protein
VLVRRDGAVVRIYSRNAINWTDRFSTIAAVAATLEAHSFTIDGEAVVIGPDGIAQFDELRRRNGAERAMLYGFDLIELNGVDLRCRPLLERKAALADLIGGTKAGIILKRHGVHARLSAWCGRRRIEAGRLILPLGAAPRLDQDQEPGLHRRAARAQPELEQVRSPASDPTTPGLI